MEIIPSLPKVIGMTVNLIFQVLTIDISENYYCYQENLAEQENLLYSIKYKEIYKKLSRKINMKWKE